MNIGLLKCGSNEVYETSFVMNIKSFCCLYRKISSTASPDAVMWGCPVFVFSVRKEEQYYNEKIQRRFSVFNNINRSIYEILMNEISLYFCSFSGNW